MTNINISPENVTGTHCLTHSALLIQSIITATYDIHIVSYITVKKTDMQSLQTHI